MNRYHHFTIEERACLRKYYVEGKVIEKLQDYWVETSARYLVNFVVIILICMIFQPIIRTPHIKSIYFVVGFAIAVCLETKKSLHI